MNAILEEKEKAAGWKSGFTNKTVWTYLYACFGLFLAKNFWFLEFTIVFLILMKMEIKIYLKKN